MFFDINEIIATLPHRYPFLLIDKVIDFEPFKFIKTIKNVTYNEKFFMGHFPDKPVMPGVLIIESLAQSACFFALKSEPEKTKGKIAYFTSIDNARFRKIVSPGDTLIHHVTIIKTNGRMWKCMCESFVDDQLVTEAEISAIVN